MGSQVYRVHEESPGTPLADRMSDHLRLVELTMRFEFQQQPRREKSTISPSRSGQDNRGAQHLS